jgi:hypothetical protein
MKKIVYILNVLIFSIFTIQTANATGTGTIMGNLGLEQVLDTSPPPEWGPSVGNPGSSYNFPTVNSNNGNTGGTVNGGYGTYAIVDSNGKVLNIVVCDVFCSNGTFGPGGDTAVLQVPGKEWGIWFGSETTLYNKETKTFTATSPIIINTSKTEEDSEGNKSIVVFTGKEILTFNSGNLFFTNGISRNIDLNSTATVSVTNGSNSESLFLGNQKTNEEVIQLIQDSNLLLLNSKVQTLISLLGTWIK